MALVVPTVTLCWRRNASRFWIMLLLISGPADHEWIGISFRPLIVGRAVQVRTLESVSEWQMSYGLESSRDISNG